MKNSCYIIRLVGYVTYLRPVAYYVIPGNIA